MTHYLKITAALLAALLLQMTLLPVYFKDPFQPNLILILVVYLGLRQPYRFGAAAAFGLGLLQDSFCGIYLGLHAFSYLCTYALLSGVADRLFTGNRLLFVLLVFCATIGCALLNMLMLMIFSVTKGLYLSLLPALIPQALMNALIASLLIAWQPAEAQETR
jgi:rod shape-determining protein MreD